MALPDSGKALLLRAGRCRTSIGETWFSTVKIEVLEITGIYRWRGISGHDIC